MSLVIRRRLPTENYRYEKNKNSSKKIIYFTHTFYFSDAGTDVKEGEGKQSHRRKKRPKKSHLEKTCERRC